MKETPIIIRDNKGEIKRKVKEILYQSNGKYKDRTDFFRQITNNMHTSIVLNGYKP